MRRPKGLVSLLTAALIGSGALGASTAALDAPGEAVAVPIAGEVTITADPGLSGIRLAVPDVPNGVRLDNEQSTVDSPYDGEFAMVQAVRPRFENGLCTTATFCRMHALYVVPDWYEGDALPEFRERNGLVQPENDCIEEQPDGERKPCAIPTPVLDIYIAADAPLTFTLRFPELDGRMSYQAEGTVRGVLEEIPTTQCPTADCDRFEIGHSVRTLGEVGTHASVSGFMYARASYRELEDGVRAGHASNIGVMGCTYPSFFVPDGSTDPADHPLGCDPHPHLADDGDIQFAPHASTFAPAPTVIAIGDTPRWLDLDGHDPGYVGFNLRNYTLPGYEGAHNAWAVWLEQGID